jgi:hypothetical protein
LLPLKVLFLGCPLAVMPVVQSGVARCGPVNAIYLKDKLAQCGGTLKLRLADIKTCPWSEEDSRYHHPHYRCTLKGPGGSYTFDFWDSIAADEREHAR